MNLIIYIINNLKKLNIAYHVGFRVWLIYTQCVSPNPFNQKKSKQNSCLQRSYIYILFFVSGENQRSYIFTKKKTKDLICFYEDM